MKESTEYTTGEAARFFGVSLQTVHNWIDNGELAAREEFRGTKRMRYVARDAAEKMKRSLPGGDDKQ